MFIIPKSTLYADISVRGQLRSLFRTARIAQDTRQWAVYRAATRDIRSLWGQRHV